MTIEIKDGLIPDINEILDIFEIPLDTFVAQALKNHISLCRMQLEKSVKKTEEMHSYLVLREEASDIVSALQDYGIPVRRRRTESFSSVYIDTYVDEEDFSYIRKIAPDHFVYIPQKPDHDMDTYIDPDYDEQSSF